MSEPADDKKESPLPEQLGREMQSAIAEVFGKHGIMVVNFISVTAVINTDGRESLWINGTPGTASWTTMGYLRYAMIMEDKGATRDEVQE